ncbi:MAG: sigma-54-dependent Fis family transcriptional regulator [Gammaproteobacteria bacterium]|nr:MAG: sigma-54-dependent Fis family transcriptional regulator [Gammaproteobacteria bacterium]
MSDYASASGRDRPIVFLVDDEAAIRKASRQWLSLAGFEVHDFASAQEALDALPPAMQGVVVSDIRMPGMDGLSFARAIQQRDPDLPVLLVTAHGDVQTAVQAMRDGVYDFIEKPVEPDLLVDRIRRAVEKRRLVLENRHLHTLLKTGSSLERRLVGQSPAMVRLRRQVMQLAQTGVDLVINGATGTGKELVARCLHEFSPRQSAPFVAVNCGAIPEQLFESELFGREKGAFTGADSQRIGKIEHANGGLLFLDEIESMPLAFQIKLLRVLQERRLTRIGSNREIALDLWVVAATKEDLRQASDAGRFREDLYYRLNVVELHLPCLAQRQEDIPLLFEYFAQQAALRHGRDYVSPDEQFFAHLRAQDWPGNVRQLKNVAERHVLGFGEVHDSVAGQPAQSGQGLNEQVQAFERQLIVNALRRHQGNIQAVLEDLKLPRRTLNNKMKQYGIRRTDCLSVQDD